MSVIEMSLTQETAPRRRGKPMPPAIVRDETTYHLTPKGRYRSTDGSFISEAVQETLLSGTPQSGYQIAEWQQ